MGAEGATTGAAYTIGFLLVKAGGALIDNMAWLFAICLLYTSTIAVVLLYKAAPQLFSGTTAMVVIIPSGSM